VQRRPQRPHLAAGLTLPLRALGRMLRDPHDRAPALLVLSLFIVGTVFYTLTEDWSVVDAFYFSTMTLATVGFGDFVPTHTGTKLFTVVYVLVGVGILVSFFSELARSTLELRAEMRKGMS
jgi:voltage-gated potassium channel